MERVVLAGVAGAAVLLPPVRDRVLAVTKATIGAGTGLAGVALNGIRDIASAAVEGQAAPATPTRETTKRSVNAGEAG